MSSITKQSEPGSSSERGSVTIMTAISMLFLLLLVGLCIDVSRIYMVRAELQNAADAAALTAARELNGGTNGIANAVTRANQIVNTQGFDKIGVDITSVQFATAVNGTYLNAGSADDTGTVENIRYVRVTTEAATTNILFGLKALGASHDESRQAVAGMSVGLNTICDFFPVAVALLDPDPAPNTTMTLNFTQGTGGSATLRDQDYIILEVPDINGNGAPETAVLSAGVTNICKTVATSIEFHMTPSANINNGPIQITDGANTRFDIRANGYGNKLKSTLPDGTYVFKPDTNIRQNITYVNYRDPAMQTPPATTGAADRRVLIVPIVDLSISPQVFNPPNAPVAKFGAFFMKKRIDDPQTPCSKAGNICGRLEVEWIDESLVASGYYTGCTDSTLSVPVLYR